MSLAEEISDKLKAPLGDRANGSCVCPFPTAIFETWAEPCGDFRWKNPNATRGVISTNISQLRRGPACGAHD